MFRSCPAHHSLTGFPRRTDGFPHVCKKRHDAPVGRGAQRPRRSPRGQEARPATRASKNHYGSRSERGTRTAALFYSLIESAKLCGVEPRAYLREATLRAVRRPGTVTLARELKPSES